MVLTQATSLLNQLKPLLCDIFVLLLLCYAYTGLVDSVQSRQLSPLEMGTMGDWGGIRWTLETES